ncbi:MAG: hypothetical protein QXI69_07535 [Candidatus Nitrosocaldus sp.]
MRIITPISILCMLIIIHPIDAINPVQVDECQEKIVKSMEDEATKIDKTKARTLAKTV